MNYWVTDHRAALEQQALAFDRIVDDVNHLARQRVLLKQMREPKNCALVMHRIVTQIELGKTTHRLDFVKRILPA